MIFSAKKLRQDKTARGLLPKEHIEACDGLTVEFKNGDKFGLIPHYEVNGKDCYLYPVDKKWCSDQTSLFEGVVE